MNKIYGLLIVFLLTTISVFSQKYPATEIRAVWLTTNYNLDWPRNKTSVEAQKTELIRMLDELKKHNFNTVLFQTRNSGEVLYRSKIEPMYSSVATSYGKDSFDPLGFMVEECHKRGMECHAWLVTYPLGGRRHQSSLGGASVVKKHRDIVTLYKGAWFLDPGNPRTDDYLLSIVKEIVNNYDVDGVHFDYIRYPDRAKDFTDLSSYRKYGKGQNREDWRRQNINMFVAKVYDWVKSAKPWVMVSSSPLGRYKPVYPNPNDTWTAYYSVYQDAAQWMKAGKHDAVFPMMYYRDQLFYPYLDEWLKNSNGRFVVPGLGIYQIQELGWLRSEITDQIEYSRDKGAAGNAFFRTEHVLRYNRSILNAMEDNYYKYPAKMPAMTWLSEKKPDSPYDLTAEQVAADFQLRWKIKDAKPRVTYNVYRTESDSLDMKNGANLLATGLHEPVYMYRPPLDDKAYYYFITVSDPFHNESVPTVPAFFWHSETKK
ncbi:MAG: family 10 glycosylhydrolase [Petrimonas sp.]|nr:family 10 glycosylhydrolase [Petrimonas sp.]